MKKLLTKLRDAKFYMENFLHIRTKDHRFQLSELRLAGSAAIHLRHSLRQCLRFGSIDFGFPCFDIGRGKAEMIPVICRIHAECNDKRTILRVFSVPAPCQKERQYCKQQ